MLRHNRAKYFFEVEFFDALIQITAYSMSQELRKQSSGKLMKSLKLKSVLDQLELSSAFHCTFNKISLTYIQQAPDTCVSQGTKDL